MPAYRKASSALRDFDAEIRKLRSLDGKNQRAFSTSTSSGISKTQLHMLTEGVLFSAFRAYESYVRHVFLLYACGKSTANGKKMVSYLDAKNSLHAETLIKQTKPFLDWSNPDVVIQRAELFLRDAAPVKDVLASNTASLKTIKAVRNHIAHNSEESLAKYKRVLIEHFGTLPIDVPEPGAFLLLQSRGGAGSYLLDQYLQTLQRVGTGLAG